MVGKKKEIEKLKERIADLEYDLVASEYEKTLLKERVATLEKENVVLSDLLSRYA